MQTFSEIVVKETILSRKPKPYSLEVALLSVLILLFASLWQWHSGTEAVLRFAAVAEKVLAEEEYWRLLTAIALHADLGHLIINSIFFFIFSYLLYGYFGLWVYPVLTVLLGGLTNYLSLMTYPPNVVLVGASGVVYLMGGFWLMAYILIERRLSVGRRLLRVLGVGLVLLVPSSIQDRVSYRTHAIGFGVGALLATAYFVSRKEAIRAREVVEVIEDF